MAENPIQSEKIKMIFGRMTNYISVQYSDTEFSVFGTHGEIWVSKLYKNEALESFTKNDNNRIWSKSHMSNSIPMQVHISL